MLRLLVSLYMSCICVSLLAAPRAALADDKDDAAPRVKNKARVEDTKNADTQDRKIVQIRDDERVQPRDKGRVFAGQKEKAEPKKKYEAPANTKAKASPDDEAPDDGKDNTAPVDMKKEKAKARFDTGKALMREEKYEVAATEFKASIRLYPTANAHYNLSQCYRALQQYEDALLTLEETKEQFGHALSDDMRAAVEADLKEIRGLVAVVEIAVDKSDATVTLDGTELGTSPISRAAVLEPGKHTIGVSLDGHESQERTIEVAAGEHKKERFALQALPPPAPPAPAAQIPQPKRQTNINQALFWTGIVGTAVTGALAGIFWGLAVSSHSDFKHNNSYIEKMYDDDPDLPDALALADSARDKTERYNKLGVGFTIAAGLLTAGTIAIFTSGYYGEESDGVEVSILPDGVAVRF